MPHDPTDPKGLIREAYSIDGITPGECRSIFLDWALGVEDPTGAIPRLLERHGAEGHPMTEVLRAGLASPTARGRRGGRAGRLS
ncbi:hypothetical protein [Jannaschia aquimarina]|uniref:Uncharacterized protein n=1 Tax=Jannaschia aquimarina TaxID=935700 RepID=A0A0D1ELH4_9RHOB|nr:hypothetical protein [Jannaschia aquimarina]KIT17796.1 hypothetical protein jaqu_04550 [Jannaschia aquimarina]SNT14125.1 hypothetical protein SAMN05421775_106161 [Jannaschia aquimarina]